MEVEHEEKLHTQDFRAATLRIGHIWLISTAGKVRSAVFGNELFNENGFGKLSEEWTAPAASCNGVRGEPRRLT